MKLILGKLSNHHQLKDINYSIFLPDKNNILISSKNKRLMSNEIINEPKFN